MQEELQTNTKFDSIIIEEFDIAYRALDKLENEEGQKLSDTLKSIKEISEKELQDYYKSTEGKLERLNLDIRSMRNRIETLNMILPKLNIPHSEEKMNFISELTMLNNYLQCTTGIEY